MKVSADSFVQARYDQQCVKDAAAAGTLLTLKGLNDSWLAE